MSTPYIGEIRIFGFQRVPAGWMSCDGSLLAISQYDVLFNLLGTTYGGDGQNTFALPDLRGQLPLHNGSGPGLTPRIQGEGGGSETVTLLPTQIPQHSHAFSATSLTATGTLPSTTVELGAASGDTLYATDLGVATLSLAPGSTTSSGGSQPHDNTMPTLTVQYCIALEGIYPPQS